MYIRPKAMTSLVRDAQAAADVEFAAGFIQTDTHKKAVETLATFNCGEGGGRWPALALA